MILSTVIFLCLGVYSVTALSCPPCEPSLCESISYADCPFGIGSDICGCCDRCLKGPGESCEGLWNIEGHCGEGLKCVRDLDEAYLEFGGRQQLPGICKKDKPRQDQKKKFLRWKN